MQSLGSGAYTPGPVNFQNVEVAVCSTPLYSVPKDWTQVLILVSGYVILGTGITQITWNIRRGSGTTGLGLGLSFPQSVIASTNVLFSLLALDTLILGAQAQWTCTATGTGATANSFAQNMTMAAIFLQ